MVVALLVLLAVALGAEPEPAEVPAAEEVIVYGELLIRQARDRVDQDLRDAGFTDIVKKDDKVIYRHPQVWRGEVHVYDDGWYRTKRQRVKFDAIGMPWAERGSPLAVAGCFLYPYLCFKPNGALISTRKFRKQETAIADRVHADVQEWADRLADLETGKKTDALPARFDALWTDGAPLMGELQVSTMAGRREALFTFWDSRTETPWGRMVRDAVEAFCRGVVQHSDHPFTDDELAAFNDRRTSVLPFSVATKTASADP